MNPAKVQIEDGTVVERKVGDYVLKSQTGYLVNGREAIKIRVDLPRDGQPYPPGDYAIAADSLDRDQWGSPCFGRRGLHLIRLGKV